MKGESVVTCDACGRARKASSMLMTQDGGEVCRFCVRAVGAQPIKLAPHRPRRPNAEPQPRKVGSLTRRAAGLRKYGMSLDDFLTMAMAQGNACAICRSEPDNVWELHVDHNHETGTVRGLLCSPCNTGIGMLGDDAQRLEAAARYLRRTVQELPDTDPLSHNGSAG